MPSNKTVSKEGYFWGHLVTIFFHIAIASVLISIYFMESWSRRKIEIICVSLGSVLLVVSLLALVPIISYMNGLQKVVLVRK